LAAAFAALRAEVESMQERLGGQPAALTATDAERFATQDDLRAARMAMLTEIRQAVQALPPADSIVVEEELLALRQEAEGAIQMLSERIDETATTAGQAAEAATAAEQAALSALARVDGAIREARIGAVSAALTSRLTNGV